jgi:hypothetical protein
VSKVFSEDMFQDLSTATVFVTMALALTLSFPADAAMSGGRMGGSFSSGRSSYSGSSSRSSYSSGSSYKSSYGGSSYKSSYSGGSSRSGSSGSKGRSGTTSGGGSSRRSSSSKYYLPGGTTYVPTTTWEPFDFFSMPSGGSGNAAIYHPIAPAMSSSDYNDDAVASAESQNSTMDNLLVLGSVSLFAYMFFWALRIGW